MISAKALKAAFQQALDEKWGYIWGTRGQTWTQANQDKATRAMTVKYGAKWIGRKVADCSGLFVWAYKQHGMSIYHGSNTIFSKYCSETGPLAGKVKIRVGTAVFQNSDGKRGHIGLYAGGGMCIEAKGTQHGVVSSPLTVWDEWGVLKDADYADEIWESFDIQPLDTLSKGAKGELVKYLQQALAEAGYAVGTNFVDGHFGENTLSAVRAFQHDHNLVSDGKVGKETWPAIKAVYADDEPDEDTEVDFEDEPAEQLTVEERLARLEAAVFGQEGVTNDGS